MSDDEDYMSDKFLHEIEKSVTSTLVHHTARGEFNSARRKVADKVEMKEKKPVRVIEQEKREVGLSCAIASDNKGFEMLVKMGYKPGQGIGKTESGITEPIAVELKSNRHGLGKLSRKTNKCQSTDLRLDNMNTTDFRCRITQKKTEQMLKIDLHKSQKICEQLDVKAEIDKPYEPWFWQAIEQINDDETNAEEHDEDVSGESLADDEKLHILTKYLRDKYFYCIWCGTAFDDEDDLNDNCPGATRNDH